MNSSDAVGVAARDRHRPPWPANALLALGAWLVVSPLVLGTWQVTTGAVSAVTGGLALAVLAGWARVARNRVPPMLIALSFGVWLLLAPSMWEFADGTDTWPLVPTVPSEVTEPTRAMVARAEWNSILAGLLTLALAGLLLMAARHRKGRAASAGRERRRQVEAPDGER
ncbi:MAG TPA: SPW repeat protein [Actinomycetota bacterium]